MPALERQKRSSLRSQKRTEIGVGDSSRASNRTYPAWHTEPVGSVHTPCSQGSPSIRTRRPWFRYRSGYLRPGCRIADIVLRTPPHTLPPFPPGGVDCLSHPCTLSFRTAGSRPRSTPCQGSGTEHSIPTPPCGFEASMLEGWPLAIFNPVASPTSEGL